MAVKVVVTGAAGFIGSNLVRELNRRGETRILCVDRLGSDGRWRNLVGAVFADYMEREEFIGRVRSGRGLPRPALVLHMGANSSTTERDVSSLVETNYAFSRDLCLWAVRTGCRFVYASSAATYGGGEHGYEDGHERIERLRPLNPYGFSKQMFDLWVKGQGLFGRVAGLKYFNVYGPGEDHKGEMRSMVRKAFEQILATGRVRLFRSHRPDYGDGEQMRDFLYVGDAVAMTLWVAERRRVNGLFNVGTGVPRTWNDLARACFRALGRPEAIEYIPMPEEIRTQYQYYTKAEMGRLRGAGYDRAVRTLEEGVAEYAKALGLA